MHTYTLMNRDRELFDVTLEYGLIRDISNLRRDNIFHFPIPLANESDLGRLWGKANRWWTGRRLPVHRNGIKPLLHLLNNFSLTKDRLDSLEELVEKCLGLSLSDQYWIRPTPDVKWDDVNFFTNDFSEDIGDLLTNGRWCSGNIMSPDNTSDGVLKKCWRIVDGDRRLYKASSGAPFLQAEPFREVFGYRMAKILLKPFDESFATEYWIEREDDVIYSVCNNFITPDTEYVPFNHINRAFLRDIPKPPYERLRPFYRNHDWLLDLMLILDYVILNEDRHRGNFGLIRSVSTGKFLRPANIFDNGASLFYSSKVIHRRYISCEPFHTDFDAQIRLVDLKRYAESIYLAKKSYREIFDEVFELCDESPVRLNSLKGQIHMQLNHLDHILNGKVI